MDSSFPYQSAVSPPKPCDNSHQHSPDFRNLSCAAEAGHQVDAHRKHDFKMSDRNPIMESNFEGSDRTFIDTPIHSSMSQPTDHWDLYHIPTISAWIARQGIVVANSEPVEGSGLSLVEPPMLTHSSLDGTRRCNEPQLAVNQPYGNKFARPIDGASFSSDSTTMPMLPEGSPSEMMKEKLFVTTGQLPLNIDTSSGPLAESPTDRKYSLPDSMTDISSASTSHSMDLPETLSPASLDCNMNYDGVLHKLNTDNSRQMLVWHDHEFPSTMYSELPLGEWHPDVHDLRHQYTPSHLYDYGSHTLFPDVEAVMLSDAMSDGEELSPFSPLAESVWGTEPATFDLQLSNHMAASSCEFAGVSTSLEKPLIPDGTYPLPFSGVQGLMEEGEGVSKVYECKICRFRPSGKAENHAAYFRKHMKTHTAPKVPCYWCSKVFTRQDNATAHAYRVHADQMPPITKRPALVEDSDGEEIIPRKRSQSHESTQPSKRSKIY